MTLDADPWALDLALTRIDGVVPRELGQHLEAAARATPTTGRRRRRHPAC